MHTVNIRVTHQKADIPTLEAFSFPDVSKTMKEIVSLPSVKECVVVQTCNRVEIFAGVENVDVANHEILGYLMSKTISNVKERLHKQHPDISPEQLLEEVKEISRKIHNAVEEDYHSDALLHLLRLTSGLESMIVGEDQILGQVKEAYNEAQKAKTLGPFLKNIFMKAINVGKRARRETKIDNGAVSIGSAGVELAESIFGSLKGKNILVIGAGEMGTLVAKALTGREVDMIFVANRTYERGIKLAEQLGGVVLKFEDIEKGIRNSDLVISATSAPHAILTREIMQKSLENRTRKELVVIDLATPRDVEEGVSKLKDITLLNIDDLRTIAERNKKIREKEIIKVEEIIEEEMSLLEKQLYRVDVEDVVKAVFETAEVVRRRELQKAMRMLGDDIGEREKEVIDDLTKAIVKKTMSPIADKVRKAAEIGDEMTVQVGKTYFMDDSAIRRRRKK
jgi:glutamyl-tRNA reductase